MHHKGFFRIVRLKDRFEEPTDGGWADLCINCILPPPDCAIFEIQVVHSSLWLVRADLGAHRDYNEYRAATEISAYLQRNDTLRAKTSNENEAFSMWNSRLSDETEQVGEDVSLLNAQLSTETGGVRVSMQN